MSRLGDVDLIVLTVLIDQRLLHQLGEDLLRRRARFETLIEIGARDVLIADGGDVAAAAPPLEQPAKVTPTIAVATAAAVRMSLDMILPLGADVEMRSASAPHDLKRFKARAGAALRRAEPDAG